MRDAIPLDDVLSWKEVTLHLAFGPPGLLATLGEPEVDPVETALRLADRVTRTRRGRLALSALVYSLAVSFESLEQAASALGITKEGHTRDASPTRASPGPR
jgi:hypothetical protein